jgi:hypothetical protein
MEETHEGRVMIRQANVQVPAEARIVVNEQQGWEIAFREDPGVRADFDETRLMQVALPTGKTGRFVQWRRSSTHRLGMGVGGPPLVPQRGH